MNVVNFPIMCFTPSQNNINFPLCYVITGRSMAGMKPKLGLLLKYGGSLPFLESQNQRRLWNADKFQRRSVARLWGKQNTQFVFVFTAMLLPVIVSSVVCSEF